MTCGRHIPTTNPARHLSAFTPSLKKLFLRNEPENPTSATPFAKKLNLRNEPSPKNGHFDIRSNSTGSPAKRYNTSNPLPAKGPSHAR